MASLAQWTPVLPDLRTLINRSDRGIAMQRLVLSGIDGVDLFSELEAELSKAKPHVLGIASAYVTITGILDLIDVCRKSKVGHCRLIAGLSDDVTHPVALEIAQKQKWEVKTAKAPSGRFHPKFFVGGDDFDKEKGVKNPSFLYVGSANATRPALKSNTEITMLALDEGVVSGADAVFARLWSYADDLTPASLADYSARFAEAARRRKPDEIRALEGADKPATKVVVAKDLVKEKVEPIGSVDNTFAAAAWAGLQSFTGEYQFQLEFPRLAGQVLKRLIGPTSKGKVKVFCEGDGQTRTMTYRFYPDNGMFRLNIPNDVPGVAWARSNKDGIALVERGPEGGAPIRLQILLPGQKASDVMERSVALGTWWRTSTRPYGWY